MWKAELKLLRNLKVASYKTLFVSFDVTALLSFSTFSLIVCFSFCVHPTESREPNQER